MLSLFSLILTHRKVGGLHFFLFFGRFGLTFYTRKTRARVARGSLASLSPSLDSLFREAIYRDMISAYLNRSAEAEFFIWLCGGLACLGFAIWLTIDWIQLAM